MKIVEITYQCNYCKKKIDQDSDVVRAILPGRIGYQDQFTEDSQEKIQHYHDTCMEHILAMTFQAEEELKKLKEEKAKKRADSKKDLGKVQSLLNAGWSKEQIADDFGVHISTVYNWIKELEGGAEVNECEDQ